MSIGHCSTQEAIGIVESELRAAALDEVATLRAERDRLRAALVRMVGVDTREELEQMELMMRSLPAPSEDKAAMLDVIHALLATLPAALTPEGT